MKTSNFSSWFGPHLLFQPHYLALLAILVSARIYSTFSPVFFGMQFVLSLFGINRGCSSHVLSFYLVYASVQFSSVTQSCPTLCDPMNRSMPGLPVHHQLPEFTQTHVHRVHDAIQPSHPVIPFSSCPPIPPSIRVFSNESTLRMRWPKYWRFSFSIIPSKEIWGWISFRMDWLDLLAVQGTLKSLL